MKTYWIDKGVLLETAHQLMHGHVHYALGIKAHPLDTAPKNIHKIDCSGFVQYLLYKTTQGGIHLPPGSWWQHEWCKKHHLAKANYHDRASQRDHKVRIAFLPAKGKHPGHVWLLLDGATMESWGHKGPDRRPWYEPILAKHVNACYILG